MLVFRQHTLGCSGWILCLFFHSFHSLEISNHQVAFEMFHSIFVVLVVVVVHVSPARLHPEFNKKSTKVLRHLTPFYHFFVRFFFDLLSTTSVSSSLFTSLDDFLSLRFFSNFLFYSLLSYRNTDTHLYQLNQRPTMSFSGRSNDFRKRIVRRVVPEFSGSANRNFQVFLLFVELEDMSKC